MSNHSSEQQQEWQSPAHLDATPPERKKWSASAYLSPFEEALMGSSSEITYYGAAGNEKAFVNSDYLVSLLRQAYPQAIGQEVGEREQAIARAQMQQLLEPQIYQRLRAQGYTPGQMAREARIIRKNATWSNVFQSAFLLDRDWEVRELKDAGMEVAIVLPFSDLSADHPSVKPVWGVRLVDSQTQQEVTNEAKRAFATTLFPRLRIREEFAPWFRLSPIPTDATNPLRMQISSPYLQPSFH